MPKVKKRETGKASGDFVAIVGVNLESGRRYEAGATIKADDMTAVDRSALFEMKAIERKPETDDVSIME